MMIVWENKKMKIKKEEYHNNKGQYCSKQWEKICYFAENIAPLEVIVFDSNEAAQLFARAKHLII